MTDLQLERQDLGTDRQYRELLDRTAISDMIYRYASAIDMRDWELLRSCFTDEIETDFRTLGDLEVFQGPAEDWVDTVRGVIEGLDATQHLISNHQHEINGDRAVCRSYVQAMHVLGTELGDPYYIIAGHYRNEMIRTAEGWRTHRYSLTVQWARGNRYLFRLAHRRTGRLLS